MKIVKIINKDKTYISKTNGKEYTSVNYYVVLDSLKWVPIRPSVKKGYDYLDAVAEVVVNGKN